MRKKYQRMLAGMKKNQTLKKKREKWFLYILECRDLSLYTGITKNLERRFKMHSSGKGARYTRSRGPLTLVYQAACKNRSDALIREYALKSLPKAKKISLIEKFQKKKRSG